MDERNRRLERSALTLGGLLTAGFGLAVLCGVGRQLPVVRDVHASWPSITPAVAVWLLYAVPHFAFHMTQLEPYGTADAVANALALGGQVVAPLLVLWLLRTRRQPAPAPGNGARMAGVPDGRGGLVARMGFRASRQQTGAVVDPVRIFAHHPLLMTGYGALEEATKRSHRVPERLKALAEMRACLLYTSPSPRD